MASGFSTTMRSEVHQIFAMRVPNAMCFCNPRCESRDFRASDGTKTSDLCTAMCLAESHLCDPMHCQCNLRSCCGNPPSCRPQCKHHCKCDATMWRTKTKGSEKYTFLLFFSLLSCDFVQVLVCTSPDLLCLVLGAKQITKLARLIVLAKLRVLGIEAKSTPKSKKSFERKQEE